MRIAVFFAGIMIWILSSSISLGYSGGTGTADDPYQIADTDDLLELSADVDNYDKCFILTADIDLAGQIFTRAVIAPDTNSSPNTGFQGTPFNGTFDGNGFSITNLYIDSQEGDCLGLFGCNGSSGCIKNLGIQNGSVFGNSYIGGLAGYNAGRIIFCHTTGSISGVSAVGGVAGYNFSEINNCYATASVSGTNSAGGLVGRGEYGTLINCYTVGPTSGTNNIGGMLGYNLEGGSFIYCYAAGLVNGVSAVGGLIGHNEDASVIACFWDTETSGQSDSDGGTGKTTAQMKTLATFTDAGWDFAGESTNGLNDYWQIQNDDYPRMAVLEWTLMGEGTPVDPYIIANFADLGKVWLRPSASYQLSEDLDLSGISWSMAVIPVFSGILDGRGHVISHLTIDHPDISNTGLLGHVLTQGQIKNLGVKNDVVSGVWCVGGLAAKNYGSITSCYAAGLIAGQYYSGGLVGYNQGTLTACYVMSTVSGVESIGGLAGVHYYDTINCCYAAGSVRGQYSVGGLVGSNRYGVLSGCYATTSVSGTYSRGGLVGDQYSGSAQICFWDVETSGQTISAGGEGKTTDRMQTLSTFTGAGWDFTEEDDDPADWYMPDEDYPQLNGEFLIPVPNTVGLDQSEAYAAIESVGFTVGTVTRIYSDTTPAGRIITQSPQPGTLYNPRPVNLTISLGRHYAGGNGTQSDPYLISSPWDLNLIGTIPADSDKCFKLTADIDMSDYAGQYNIIGSGLDTMFKGVFDGDGHIISNLTITQSATDLGSGFGFAGLFGRLGDGGRITNLRIENVNISITTDMFSYVGGLVGLMEYGTISNCHVTGSVSVSCFTSSSSPLSIEVGGLVGKQYSGTIANCGSSASVTADTLDSYTYAGGLVARNEGIIKNSYSKGAVSASAYYGYAYAGGLVSINWASIANCYSTSPVNGASTYGVLTGGLVSLQSTSSAIIEKSYAAGVITVNGSDLGKGGLVGVKYEGSVSASFWDKETTGCTASSGGGTAKTSAQMKMRSTFISAGWNFGPWDAGITGNALVFDGTDDYVEIPGFAGIGQTSARTVSLWVKTSTTGRSQELVQWGSDAMGQLWLMRLQADGTILTAAYGGGVRSTAAMTGGAWHHIVAVLDEGQTDSNQIRLYIDGVLDTTALAVSCEINTALTVPVQLGNWYAYSTGIRSNYFAGMMDDVCIYSRALATEEIVPDELIATEGLVAHWALDETKGTVAYDSVSSYDGQLNNMITADTVWAICEGTNYPRLNWQIPVCDFLCPDSVNSEDLDYFVSRWLLTNCSSDNNYCGGADMDAAGTVDLADLALFAAHWLEG